MNFLNKHAGVIALVALIIAAVLGLSKESASFGVTNQCATGQTCLPSLELTGPNSGVTNALQIDSGNFVLGSNGSGISEMITGTCDLQVNVSITATSTQYGFCSGITGLTSSSKVFVSLSTTTTAIGTQFVPVAVQASTTLSGAFDVKLLNLTGQTAVPAATSGFGSTTRYWIVN